MLLTALPFHVFSTMDAEAVLTRGTVQVKLEGDGVLSTLRLLCEQLSQAPQARTQVMGELPQKLRQQADCIIDVLLERRLLAEVSPEQAPGCGLTPESPLDIFNWHFQYPVPRAGDGYLSTPISVVGVNNISAVLAPALTAAGFTRTTVVDDVFLHRDIGASVSGLGDLVSPDDWIEQDYGVEHTVVVCSDTGAESIVREWNALCVRLGLRLVPVVLRGMVGFVGPIVLPGETACFECKVRREGATVDLGADVNEALPFEAERGKVAGFHPSMAGVLAHFATMELIKFLGHVPAYTAGVVFDINLMRPDLVPRRVLRLPDCPICSEINVTPTHSIVKVEKVV